MSKSFPKVSIITATFNSASTIIDTLNSVESQIYNNIEHVIIDGLSTDNTLQLIKSSNFKGIILSEKDKGIYDAMNKGIALASGDIIGILNSDDFYPNERIIEEVVSNFLMNGVETVYGDLNYVDSNYISKPIRKWVSGEFNKDNFLKGWMPPHPTFFVKKELYDKYGLFNISLWGAADYELMLRFLFKYSCTTAYLPMVLVYMRAGGQSNISLFNRIRANLEDRRAWRINDLKPKWYTLFLKPLRKLNQFIVIN